MNVPCLATFSGCPGNLPIGDDGYCELCRHREARMIEAKEAK